jgi:tRNA A37 threonylcarbamoyladenosine modification protein TsaB
VAACFDALRGQVFGAVYAFPPDRVETLVAPGLFTIESLARATPVRPLVAVGDGAQHYADAVAAWTGRAPLGLDAVPPVASALLALAGRDGASRSLDDPAIAEPEYGRPAEAQAKWEAHHGRPLPHSSR